MNNLSIKSALLFILISVITGCKKLIEIPPPSTELTREAVFQDSATAISAISGVYAYMYNHNFDSEAAFRDLITLTSGMAADEIYFFSSGALDQYKNNSISINNDKNLRIWSSIYNVIYQSNSILEGVEGSSLSSTLTAQLRGEALFLRSVSHFYLTNLYGKVPLILTTNVTENSVKESASIENIYDQIVIDLEEAAGLLNPGYEYSSGGTRTRANKWAAKAMLARVYLYLKDYEKAADNATEVINQTGLYNLPQLSTVFLASSEEAILQFYTNLKDYTHIQAQLSPQSDAPGVPPSYVMREELLNAFEDEDQRKILWTGTMEFNGTPYIYPSKYKRNSYTTSPPLEYDVFLRLGEVYLIRAEAYAELNMIDEAGDDLEKIRVRAGLGAPVANDKASMIAAVEHERQVELFTEYGHRWFDLKRTGRVDVVLPAVKPTTWKSSAKLFPIPQAARNTNPNLGQNDGY